MNFQQDYCFDQDRRKFSAKDEERFDNEMFGMGDSRLFEIIDLCLQYMAHDITHGFKCRLIHIISDSAKKLREEGQEIYSELEQLKEEKEKRDSNNDKADTVSLSSDDDNIKKKMIPAIMDIESIE